MFGELEIALGDTWTTGGCTDLPGWEVGKGTVVIWKNCDCRWKNIPAGRWTHAVRGIYEAINHGNPLISPVFRLVPGTNHAPRSVRQRIVVGGCSRRLDSRPWKGSPRLRLRAELSLSG